MNPKGVQILLHFAKIERTILWLRPMSDTSYEEVKSILWDFGAPPRRLLNFDVKVNLTMSHSIFTCNHQGQVSFAFNFTFTLTSE